MLSIIFRTMKCPQHSEEDRREVRRKLLGRYTVIILYKVHIIYGQICVIANHVYVYMVNHILKKFFSYKIIDLLLM